MSELLDLDVVKKKLEGKKEELGKVVKDYNNARSVITQLEPIIIQLQGEIKALSELIPKQEIEKE